jgi:hypothetical protein
MRYVNSYLAERSGLQMIQRLLQVVKGIMSIDYGLQLSSINRSHKIFERSPMTGDDALNDRRFEQNGRSRRAKFLISQKAYNRDTPPRCDDCN